MFSIELVPYIDNSGPTLTINVQHDQQSDNYKLLQSMLDGIVTSSLPRFDAHALEEKGIYYCEYLLVTLLCTVSPAFIIIFIKFTFTFKL